MRRNTVMKHSPETIHEVNHPGESNWRRIAWGIFVTMRPPEWLKNTLVFAAVIFSGNLFFRPAFASSATYVFNDYHDRQTDLAHPLKGTDRLVYTSVFVLYGIFRYLYLMYEKSGGGNPTTLVYRDVSLQMDILLWIASILFLRYYTRLF